MNRVFGALSESLLDGHPVDCSANFGVLLLYTAREIFSGSFTSLLPLIW